MRISAKIKGCEELTMIVRRNGKYYVVSEKKGSDGKRKNLGGPYNTHKEAVKRLRQVEYYSNKGK